MPHGVEGLGLEPWALAQLHQGIDEKLLHIITKGNRSKYRNMKVHPQVEPSELAKGVCKICECTNKGCIDVSGRLGLLVIGSLIGEAVMGIGPSNNCPNKDVWIWSLRFHGAKPDGALDLGWMHSN